jgi:hypothetical protein
MMTKSPKPALGTAPAFTPERTEDGRTVYELTQTAPSYIAGRPVNGATEIALTDDQARAELLALHIRPKGMPRKPRVVADAGGEAGSRSV